MRAASRRMAFCGVLVALAASVLLLGSLLPLATFSAPLLALVVLLPILAEYGRRWAWTAHGAVSILVLLLAADRELALVYVVLGCYPLLRPALQRIPTRLLQLLGKLLACNAAVAALTWLTIFVFQLEAATAELSGASAAFLAVLLGLVNLNFLVLDLVIGRLTRLWQGRLRRKFMKE